MKPFQRSLAATTFLMCGWACGGSTPEPVTGTGGKTGSGGSTSGSSGGTSGGTGGASSGSGGTPGSGGAVSSGGATASGGSTASGGRMGSGGAGQSGGSGGRASDGGVDGPTGSGGRADAGGGSGGALGTGGSSTVDAGALADFSFFVTSIGAMRELSANEKGFGGDLKYGEADGLAGADKICRTIAEKSMPGSGAKGWKAFLSITAGPVHAIDRLGPGPWYDRMGRIVALNKTDLVNVRPKGAHPAIIDDLPNENGIPNHTDGAPGCTNNCPDNHDVLTGTGPNGKLKSTNVWSTCYDWTYKENVAPQGESGPGGGKGPWCGHSWPRKGSGEDWMSSLAEGGCAPGVNLQDNSVPMGSAGNYTVGIGGGYGAIYCFANTR